MAIIGKVEKKSLKVRVLNISIHVLLLLGAVTMVYPLLLMVSGSFKSDVDFSKFSLLPEFIYNHELLFQKHLATKFNAQNILFFNAFREPIGSVNNVKKPENPSRVRFDDYKAFLGEMKERKPHYWRGIGMANETGVYPMVLREYRAWLAKKYGKGEEGIKKLNEACGTDYTSWEAVALPVELFHTRKISTDYSKGILKEILEFKNTQISGLHTYWVDLDGFFVESLRKNVARELPELNKKLGTHYNSWQDIPLPRTYPKGNEKFAKLWGKYVREDVNYSFLRLDPSAAPLWTKFLKEKYKDIKEVNALHEYNAKTFDEVKLPLQEPAGGQIKTDWNEFVSLVLPPEYMRLETLAGEYRDWLKKKYGTVARLNDVYDMGYKSMDAVPLPEEHPQENIALAKDWTEFVNTMGPEEISLVRTAIADYRNFIENKYRKADKTVDYDKMSIDYKSAIRNKLEIPFYSRYPASPDITMSVKDHYREFVTNPKNGNARVVADVKKMQPLWSKFLQNKYKNIAALNHAWGTVYTSWDKIAPPSKEYEWFSVLDHKWDLVKEYLKRNYVMVVDTIITNGNAAKNTVIYCALAVLAALIVNPLCAYALSRYKMAPAYKILLFLMLPMAFPPMVLGIPQFLLIKNLNLLNTFWALILPTMANGYMIFLLKGFFDSLPKELFESAAIDGASEWTVFWHIAMGLSTPILSVLALNTFTVAYGNFMMAFLLCQDKSMWTMMVHLYQLQIRSSQAVGFAALIIAAVPTLLVFIFCQNIIIKGIVVPTEK